MTVDEKIKRHEEAIYTAAYAAGFMGISGAVMPAVDLVAIAGIWATMLVAIARTAGRSLDRDTGLKLASSVAVAGAAYAGGSKLAIFALNVIPGVGFMSAVGINCLLNFLYTMRLGRFLALQMEKPEFDTGDFASLIPELTTMVFALPSIMEMRETWLDYRSHEHYKH